MHQLTGSRGMLAVAALAAALVVCTVVLARADDRVTPPPTRIPHVKVRLPPSTRAYYAHESGLQHTMLQVRFEIDASEAPLLASRLPCKLGPVEKGAPSFAQVGTNDRTWYRADAVTVHRGCDYHRDLLTASFLLDVADPQRTVVYAVVEKE